METQTKQVALITGASRGIGRAIAIRLSKDGYHVLINYKSRSSAASETLQCVLKHGGSGELLPFDVVDSSACEEAVKKSLEKHGAIDVLVNNAGIRKDDLLVWVLPEDWTNMIDTNLKGFYNVTRPVVKDMLLKRKGRIINISSTSGQTGLPGQVSYSAAKAGVIGATKALAKEVAKRGITVNAVCPGFIDTDIIEGLDMKKILGDIPVGRLGKPEEVAGAVSFLCSEDAAYITGSVISVNGGIYI